MVHIEDYRGWSIDLDTEDGSFIAIGSNYDTQNKSSSLKAARKSVDDYVKANVKFIPFTIYRVGSHLCNKYAPVKVVGIRKDGAFMLEEGGKKEQLSGYNEKDYTDIAPDPDKVDQWNSLKDQINALNNQINAFEKEIAIPSDKWAADAREKYADLIG
jgi:hypothetical protein